LLSRILEETDLIAPFSFFANAASTLQECTLTYHRPMPKKDIILVGGEINFLLGELRARRTPQPSTSARTRINNLNEAA
jgi:hypothetical protein